MIRVEKNIGRATSFARFAIVLTVSSFSGLSSRFFNIVSIITMAPSTMIPKSIAPKESKFAGMLVTFIKMKAINKEIGIVIATKSAPRQLPNTIIRIRITSPIPSIMVLEIVANVVSTKSVLSRTTWIFTPSGKPLSLSSSTAAFTPSRTFDGFSPFSKRTIP